MLIKSSLAVCVATKYDTSPGAAELHRECLRMARQHQTLAFAEAQTSLEIVQAITILALWKEPEDDRAAFYFNRVRIAAVKVMAHDTDVESAGRRNGQGAPPGPDTPQSRWAARG